MHGTIDQIVHFGMTPIGIFITILSSFFTMLADTFVRLAPSIAARSFRRRLLLLLFDESPRGLQYVHIVLHQPVVHSQPLLLVLRPFLLLRDLLQLLFVRPLRGLHDLGQPFPQPFHVSKGGHQRLSAIRHVLHRIHLDLRRRSAVQQPPLDVIRDDSPGGPLVIGVPAASRDDAPRQAEGVEQLPRGGTGHDYAPPHDAAAGGGVRSPPLLEGLEGGDREFDAIGGVEDLAGDAGADEVDDRPVVAHLGDGVDPAGDEVGGAGDEGGEDEAGAIAQHDVAGAGEEDRLEVFGLAGLGRHAYPDVAVFVSGGADEAVDDGGFSDVGEAHHAVLDAAVVAGRVRGRDFAAGGEGANVGEELYAS
mmetsp:Transcript_3731/g.6926  ORF Transcript_3731/g.6926 Transcript_3731/m.6926 type:complete len:363 (+) Transcript_3731:295-1383(+)